MKKENQKNQTKITKQTQREKLLNFFLTIFSSKHFSFKNHLDSKKWEKKKINKKEEL